MAVVTEGRRHLPHAGITYCVFGSGCSDSGGFHWGRLGAHGHCMHVVESVRVGCECLLYCACQKGTRRVASTHCYSHWPCTQRRYCDSEPPPAPSPPAAASLAPTSNTTHTGQPRATHKSIITINHTAVHPGGRRCATHTHTPSAATPSNTNTESSHHNFRPCSAVVRCSRRRRRTTLLLRVALLALVAARTARGE